MKQEWISPKAIIEFEEDACFSVDFINKQLCDTDVPGNIIKLEDLKDTGAQYEFYYDTNKRNIGIPLNPYGPDTDTIYKVRIDHLVALLPQAIINIYGVDASDLKGKTDQEFFSSLPAIRASQWEKIKTRPDFGLIEKRLAGSLPLVSLGNEKFNFDGEQGVFQHTEKEHIKIELSKMAPVAGSGEFACFVNAWDCSPIYDHVASFGLHMLAHIEVPAPEILDPVGIARLRGFKETDLLYKYPLEETRQIKITPLSERAALQINKKDRITEENKSNQVRSRKGYKL